MTCREACLVPAAILAALKRFCRKPPRHRPPPTLLQTYDVIPSSLLSSRNHTKNTKDTRSLLHGRCLDQMRSGVQRSNTVAGLRERSNEVEMWVVRVDSAGTLMAAGAACTSRRACTVGRADSSTGHWSTTLADRVVVPSAGSCAGQCDVLSVAGVTHVTSHHARAGAAAPSINAQARMSHCLTPSV